MKSKWKIIVLTGIGIVVVLLSRYLVNSCRKEQNVNNNKFPSKYSGKSEFVEFDIDIVSGIENKFLYKSTATITEFDATLAVPLMFKDKFDSSSIEKKDNNFIHENGNTFFVQKNYLSFNSNSQLQKDIMKSFSLFKETYTADQFEVAEFVDTSLNQKIIDQCISLGVNNMRVYKVYNLDYHTLQSNENHTDKLGNKIPVALRREWTEEDSSTFWLGRQVWQGLPVFCSSYSSEVIDTWAPIQILYTRNGIEKLQVLYAFQFRMETKKINLKSFESIATAVEKEYSMILTDNRYVAKRAELYYWVDVNQDEHELKMIPVWVVTIREYDKAKENYVEIQKIVNAETAEIIETGE